MHAGIRLLCNAFVWNTSNLKNAGKLLTREPPDPLLSGVRARVSR